MYETTFPKDTELVKAIRDLAAESPDFVYTRQEVDPDSLSAPCNYWPDEKNPQGCIVGAAMRKIGHSLDGIEFRGVAAFTALEDLALFQPSTGLWVNNVQSWQDKGLTWSEAVKKADEISWMTSMRDASTEDKR